MRDQKKFIGLFCSLEKRRDKVKNTITYKLVVAVKNVI
jgi:hypothetical protein